jgi:hypothetical protein
VVSVLPSTLATKVAISSLAGGFLRGSAADDGWRAARRQAEDHRRVDAEKIAGGERDHQRADTDAAPPDAPPPAPRRSSTF